MLVKSNGRTSQLTLGFPRILKPCEYIMQFMMISMKWKVIQGMDFFELSGAIVNFERRCLIFRDERYEQKTIMLYNNGNEIENKSARAIVEDVVMVMQA